MSTLQLQSLSNLLRLCWLVTLTSNIAKIAKETFSLHVHFLDAYHVVVTTLIDAGNLVCLSHELRTHNDQKLLAFRFRVR